MRLERATLSDIPALVELLHELFSQEVELHHTKMDALILGIF